MKVTKGAKAATPGTAAYLHKVFGKKHEQDRERAAKLRSFGGVIAVRGKPKMAEAFPERDQVFSFWGVVSDDKQHKAERLDERDADGNIENPEKGAAFYKNIFKNRNFYRRKAGGKDKNGDPKMRKQPTEGVKEHSISPPIGWSYVLADEVRTRAISPKDLNAALGKIGLELLKESSKRTGYDPLFMLVHPDSVSNVHFHLGISSVDPITHKLIGRSGKGKRGKQGLREAGFDFLNIWRNSKAAVLNVDEQTKYEEMHLKVPKLKLSDQGNDWEGKETVLYGGFDDIALSIKLEQLLKQKFPDLVKTADKYTAEHATSYIKNFLNTGRTHSQKTERISELTAERDTLKAQLRHFKQFPLHGKNEAEVSKLVKAHLLSLKDPV